MYLRMRQDILSGKLKPGSKLRFTDLAENYKAGNSTLRESLSRLTADRLVIAQGQRGFRSGVGLARLDRRRVLLQTRLPLPARAAEDHAAANGARKLYSEAAGAGDSRFLRRSDFARTVSDPYECRAPHMSARDR